MHTSSTQSTGGGAALSRLARVHGSRGTARSPRAIPLAFGKGRITRLPLPPSFHEGRPTGAWIRRGARGASLRVPVVCTWRLVAAPLFWPPCILYARAAGPHAAQAQYVGQTQGWQMSRRKLPTVEELEGRDLAEVLVVAKSEGELRFRVTDPDVYPEHPPFDIVFDHPEAFRGPEALYDVCLCARGPSPDGEGFVYEFQSRELVPTDGRAIQAEVVRGGETKIRFGRTVSTVVAQVVALSAAVQDAVDLA
jgi:hypothetical protein